jgi:hypothetical protein
MSPQGQVTTSTHRKFVVEFDHCEVSHLSFDEIVEFAHGMIPWSDPELIEEARLYFTIRCYANSMEVVFSR